MILFLPNLNLNREKNNLESGFEYVLTRSRWHEIAEFSQKIGAYTFMTLNAGPGPRRKGPEWKKKNAKKFVRLTIKDSDPASVWEFGNEVNAYPFFHGMRNFISRRQYAEDIGKFFRMIKKENAGKVAGPAAAVWPVLGETLPFLKRFLSQLEVPLDILTWHYYPQQSCRSPVASRRAKPKTMLNAQRLNEVGRYARKIQKFVDRYSPGTHVWLGETGHALCGGEPGLSDRFVSSLWWIDELGQLSLCGHRQVVRQALIGGDYGLLHHKDISPNPDYWATLLWNRFMGREVYEIETIGSRNIRVYLHGIKHNYGKDRSEVHSISTQFTFCVLNIYQTKKVQLEIGDQLPPIKRVASVTAEGLFSRSIKLNSKPLKLTENGKVPPINMKEIKPTRLIELPPLSYAFFAS